MTTIWPTVECYLLLTSRRSSNPFLFTYSNGVRGRTAIRFRPKLSNTHAELLNFSGSTIFSSSYTSSRDAHTHSKREHACQGRVWDLLTYTFVYKVHFLHHCFKNCVIIAPQNKWWQKVSTVLHMGLCSVHMRSIPKLQSDFTLFVISSPLVRGQEFCRLIIFFMGGERDSEVCILVWRHRRVTLSWLLRRAVNGVWEQ